MQIAKTCRQHPIHQKHQWKKNQEYERVKKQLKTFNGC